MSDLYDPSDNLTQATILLPFVPTKVELAGLDELLRQVASSDTTPALEQGGRVKIALAPKKIITLRIERA
jgi:hypothetical protein